ncbi:MAG: selenocysteine-specific translation elongation factor [Chloroflexi bacterium 13_1_40CM_3_65_12]|nr:MAG: selenocysteine-specific translation elongation factor [Chloroflexi bacterium 13_1_40CM_65_17]OLC66192.1 MAG: selenocysteine-specific translation elongation factor [Actinobacteria bacterium 13_1_40CM_4_65_12]OLD23801.1 MAG: selenocysteine-specific translation elongation factor [Chloroflexi bacterium 13_1_40CM_3_65_12]OLD48688.1 MAG: selenocysteine-specific translation elongation factor [Actinobacteria bacterium 13_1_40CM_2_65_8]
MILGTAGHIDHGKSTLVTALTGIDPDRLAEEKRRGMTIDLGFAHLRLPSGRQVGIVDVPGHARFIRNMLAGAQGIDAVILVVAADEGVMPQTREHLEIVDLLEVRHGLVALTKVDLVDEVWYELVEGEVRDALKNTSLDGSVIQGVSAITGQGMGELVSAIDSVFDAVEPKADIGRPRLPIDRVFTMAGYGTVVTGTLVDGAIAVGDELQILPGGSTARVRGLQQHNQKVEAATPGNRVAANLSGVEKNQVDRGDVLARPGALRATRRVDARVRVLASAPRGLRHGSELLLHTGTVEVGCRAILLEGDTIEPGAQAWIQLYLERPIAAGNDDRFILRIPSPSWTVAGGQFNDVAPRKHPRHDIAVRESLERRAGGDVLQEELRKYPRGVTVTALLKATTASDADMTRLHARRLDDWLFAPEAWAAIGDRAVSELDSYHRAHPLRRGMPREELRSKLGIQAGVFAPVMKALAEEGRVEERDGEVASPSHQAAMEAPGGPAARLLELLGAEPYAPPSLPEAMRTAGVTSEMVRALVQHGDLVRLSDDVAFTRTAYEQAVAAVKEAIATTGSVSVAQLRDRLGASRRPMLALLEHLDAAKVTRRVGDARVLR